MKERKKEDILKKKVYIFDKLYNKQKRILLQIILFIFVRTNKNNFFLVVWITENFEMRLNKYATINKITNNNITATLL